MNYQEMMTQMKQVFKICEKVHKSGQKEYADNERNAFANFDRLAERLDMSNQEVLMVYLMKHVDGIVSYIKGHESQREDVRGRITDAIVYLTILYAMIEDKDLKHAMKATVWDANVTSFGDKGIMKNDG